jgi:hypothetical protein
MRSIGEILKSRQLSIISTGADGLSGYIFGRAVFVFSYGGGWEHLSVSFACACPTWEQMCTAKSIFWGEEECCVQYHPAKSDYVNLHPYCLHIWKPIGIELPKPPKSFVG